MSSNNSSAKEDKRQVFASVEYRAINYNSDVSTWIVGQDAIQICAGHSDWYRDSVLPIGLGINQLLRNLNLSICYKNLHTNHDDKQGQRQRHIHRFTGMLSPRDQRGLEAKIFGLSLVTPDSASASSSCNAGLVLTKVVLVASLSVIEITSFTLRFSVIENCFTFYWS